MNVKKSTYLYAYVIYAAPAILKPKSCHFVMDMDSYNNMQWLYSHITDIS